MPDARTESRVVWLNGKLVEERAATVSVFDRGFLFGDGIYEVVRFFRCESGAGRRRFGVGMDLHVARLARSLRLARIEGFDARDLPRICDEVLDANDLDDASVYLQVTRGVSGTRSHVPAGPLVPTVLAMAQPCDPLERFGEPAPMRVVTLEDPRWRLCSIKTTSLMGNVMAMLDADARGASEAILVRDGLVGECGSANVFALFGSELVTPPVDDDPPILHGVTRAELLELAPQAGVRPVVRPLPANELRGADEVLLSSSRRIVAGIVAIDDVPVGAGTVGRITRALHAAMRRHIAEACRAPALAGT